MQLQDILYSQGFGTRRICAGLIQQGYVQVDLGEGLVTCDDALEDVAVFAWDARGHGRSPGERGFSPSLGTSVRDLQTFVSAIDTVKFYAELYRPYGDPPLDHPAFVHVRAE